MRKYFFMLGIWLLTGFFAGNAEELTIITLSNPRSVTTAFERSFVERDDVMIVHEPWSCFFWSQRGNVCLEAQVPEYISSAGDFWDLTRRIQKMGADKILFVKDFAFSTYPMILQDKQFLADPNVKFIFLIREPKAVLASYYKMLPAFEDFCVDYKALHEVFLEVWRCQGVKPLVIDAEDLTANPRKTLSCVCNRLGILFIEKMLSWERGMLDMWQCYSKWHVDAANSVEFNKGTKNEQDPFLEVPEKDRLRLMKMYEVHLPFYKALYQHRLV